LANLSPIALFVYNRPEHTKRTVEFLLKNTLASESRLIIFSDGAKNENDSQKVQAVRNYIKTIKSFERIEIVLRDRNFGLANSVISGVTEVFKQNDRVIVMEDDIITSPSFLTFMNKALAFYQDNKSIYSISGYPYPIKIPNAYEQDIFISYRASSWGWGTWKDRWEKVDWEVKDFSNFISDKKVQNLFDRGGQDLTPMLKSQMKGKIDSWAIRWGYAHLKNNAYCLYPVTPLCKNIGTDKSGTHSSSSIKLDVELRESDKEFVLSRDPELNEDIVKEIQKLFKLTLIRRIINFIKLS
jgi:hypothetical protein